MNLEISFGKRSFRIQTGMQPAAPVAQNRGPSALQSVGARMFAAAQSNRLTADWPVTITSADAEILQSAIPVVSRMRQAERDDDYFRGMLALLENNVIGDMGIRLRMKSRLADGTLDKATNLMIQDQWAIALTEKNCTVRRNQNGIELQRLAVRCLARDGLILFRKHRPFKNAFGFALEAIERDRLDHWWNRPATGTGNEIKFGLELDQNKAIVAFWILTRHPGDVFAFSSSAYYRERVPAEDIIAVWTTERAEQSIGMPLWPSVCKRLHNVYRYEESEQIAARAGASKGGWFQVDPKAAGQDEYVGPTDDQGNQILDTQPGQWETLPAGYIPHQNDPTHPTDAFSDFIKAQIRGAAAGATLPYNSVAQDLESVNYSSYKAGMNEARANFKYLQNLIMRKLMRPWFEAWLPYAIMSGRLPTLTVSDVARLQELDRWKPLRWAGLEPLKEVQAAQAAVASGFDSRRNIIEEQYDRDIEDVDEEQEHDAKSAKEHGLKLSFGVTQPPEEGDEAESGGKPKPKEGKSGSDVTALVKRNGHTNGHSSWWAPDLRCR